MSDGADSSFEPPSPSETIALVERWRDGDEIAARELFERFADRVRRFGAVRLHPSLERRFDADDVVQSVFQSVFRMARDGALKLRRSGDLWSVLAALTHYKVLNQVAYHNAAKRSPTRELHEPSNLRGVWCDLPGRELGVEDAAALAEEIAWVGRALNPSRRRAFELRLQDCTLEEIAREMNFSERTVRKYLDDVKVVLSQRFVDVLANLDPSAPSQPPS
ncbi:MAG: sigma-70 family RNA polymerase sigma factor [Planctomycetota bacterium]|nr:sigma-70 family RNA polymerase sigma factor [Planctomycetota bacterium]